MIRYCGREFTPDELEQIQSLIKHNPGFNRTRLSTEVCQILQWIKPDGKLKDMSCRVAMLRMDKDGLIQLPPSTRKKQPVRTILFTPATAPRDPLVCPVNQLPQLQDKGFDKRARRRAKYSDSHARQTPSTFFPARKPTGK